MTQPRFFGYGSLVNLATHDFPDARPARLAGWRRVWRHTDIRPYAFLSVEPCDMTVIEGISAAVPNADWAALDAREYAYVRRDVTHQVDHPAAQTAVYQVEDGRLAPPSTRHPILLSYIDVVVQGFLRIHGADGARRFFDTTHGWEQAPVLHDRPAPIYPRATILTAQETSIVDHGLAQKRAVIL